MLAAASWNTCYGIYIVNYNLSKEGTASLGMATGVRAAWILSGV